MARAQEMGRATGRTLQRLALRHSRSLSLSQSLSLSPLHPHAHSLLAGDRGSEGEGDEGEDRGMVG